MEPARITRHSAVIGTVIWIAWQLLAEPFEPAALFVLAPLVLVPLLLRPLLLDTAEAGLDGLGRTLIWAQLPCALPLPLALMLEPGSAAMLACLPWAGWTALAAGAGARRLIQLLRRRGAAGLVDGELALAAALGFPLVGSAWLLADRLGLTPLGFSPLIVLLTAVHFHHAGFTLPAAAGLLTRWRSDQRRWRFAALAVVVAVPLTAAGITASPLIELLGAALTTLAGLFVASGLLLRARSLPVLPSLLSALAGAALLAAMVLAGTYALAEYRGLAWPDIPTMLRLHGAVNALGFGLLGAWAWHLSPPRPKVV